MVLNTDKPDPQIKDMSINFRQLLIIHSVSSVFSQIDVGILMKLNHNQIE
jgi:hypothetical protein